MSQVSCKIYHHYACPGFIIPWSICISNYFSLYMIMYTFPSSFFFGYFNFLWCFRITFFPVSTSVYRKGLPMRSLQVSQHTDILQTQRRFYLFCYSTKFQHLHNTSYFQELTQGRGVEIPFIFKHRTWTPFPTSNPSGKILESEALLFPLLRRYKEQGETPKLPGEGTYVGRETQLKVFCLSNLDNIPHCITNPAWFSSLNSLKLWLKRNNRRRWLCPRVVTIPKHTQGCHHRTRKTRLQLVWRHEINLN